MGRYEAIAYGSTIKQIEKLIWEYLDALNFDCDGMEIGFDIDIQSYTIEVQIKDKDGGLYPYKLDPFAEGFSCGFSARMIAEQYVNNKEDDKMTTKYNLGNCESFCTNAPAPKTAEQVEYEHKLLALQRTLEDEVKAAKDKYALAVDALNKERENAKHIAEEDKAARNRKDRYDALVRAGFTEEQAWKMLMQDLGA